jgi:2-polyprenyl-3-methyl-5-hydroxy-6-metoxy-1,4-benzoquinol methylase
LDNISENDCVLDVGCASGEVAYDLAKKARKVTGIEILPAKIKIAKEKNNAGNIEYLIGDATEYDFKDKFDVIILSNVLEHIKERVDFLSKLKVLAPKILIRVPLITRDWISYYKKENGFSYLLDPSHCIEYAEDEFKEEIEKAGLKIESIIIRFGELYAVIRKI